MIIITCRTIDLAIGPSIAMCGVYVLDLKDPPGASSDRIFRPSICLSVRLSVIASRLRYSYQIEVHICVPNTSPTSKNPCDGAGSKCSTSSFLHILTSVSHKDMSIFTV